MDWSEKDLEDWLWEHPEAIGCTAWVHRQFPVDGGVADLIGLRASDNGNSQQMVVVELKAVRASASAIVQVCDYITCLRVALIGGTAHNECGPEWFPRALCSADFEADEDMIVVGYVVAPSFSQRVVRASMEMPRVSILTVSEDFALVEQDVTGIFDAQVMEYSTMDWSAYG